MIASKQNSDSSSPFYNRDDANISAIDERKHVIAIPSIRQNELESELERVAVLGYN